MSKFLLFSLLWWITGSPFLSILLLLLIFYFLDRRYVGLFPSVTKPFQIARRQSKIKQELLLNPHHTSHKQELAEIFIGKRQYAQALPYIQQVHEIIPDSPEVLYQLGLCHLKLGNVEEGEQLILKALDANPMLRYGEPYLALGEVYSHRDATKALHYLERIRDIHSSSVEIYYHLGKLFVKLDRQPEAKAAFKEARQIYRSLPKYLRRQQRKWAWLSSFK